MQLAESNDDKLAQQVLTDIVDKERGHAYFFVLRGDSHFHFFALFS